MTQGETGAQGETGMTGIAGAAGAEGAVGRTGQQGEPGPAAMLDPATAAYIKRGLKILTWATVVLYLATLVIGGWGYLDAKSKRDDIEKVAVTTNTALCSIRHNLEVQTAASKLFLKENPKGIPGISAVQIQDSIDNQTNTIKSLKILSCAR